MLYEQASTLQLVKTFTCATGENPGNKIESGDSRTPEGVYFITEIYEDNKITVFGSRAFHLDYPNIFDTHAGRTGNGIFIHGTNKELIPFSSNGCITLDNKDLDQLAPYLAINKVPIVIVESLANPLNSGTPSIYPGSAIFKGILTELKLDSSAIPEQDIISMYFLEAGQQAVAMVNYTIYDGDLIRYSYHKRSYLTKSINQQWRSIYAVEGQDAIPYLLAQKIKKTGTSPVVSVQEQVTEPQPPAVEPAATEEELFTFIEHWRKSWSAKELDAYMDCYSPDFSDGKLNKEQWRAKKRYLNDKYDFINITIKDVVFTPTDTGMNVSFYQTYESDKYKTSGTKHLQLVNKDSKWKILKEYM